MPVSFLALGVWLGQAAGWPLVYWLAGAVGLLVAAPLVSLRGKRALMVPCLAMAAFFTGGGLLVSAEMRINSPFRSLEGRQVRLQGVVVGKPVAQGDIIRAPVRVWVNGVHGVHGVHGAAMAWSRSANGEMRGVTGAVLVRFKRGGASASRLPAYGSLVSLSGRLERIEGRRNPGEADWRLNWLARGMGYSLYAGTDWRVEGSGRGNPLMALAYRVGDVADRILDSTLAPAEAATVRALVLGDRTDLDGGLKDAYRVTGLTHVLSVSGLHVGFLAAGVQALLRMLKTGPRVGVPVLLVTLAGYVAITGMQTPVLRAAIMFGMASLGWFVGRKAGGLNLLALALAVILIDSPHALFDPGLQLSFLATGGILTLVRPLEGYIDYINRRRSAGIWAPTTWIARKLVARMLWRWVRQGLAVTLAAQLAVLPAISIYFGQVSLLGPVANLVAVPLAGVAVTLAFLGILAGAVSLAAGSIVNSVTGAAVFLLNHVVELAARWPLALSLPYPNALGVIAYYLLLALLFGRLPDPGRPTDRRLNRLLKLAAIPCLCLLLVFGFRLPPAPRGLEVVFLDVGQGDAIVLHMPLGRVMVVDGGPPGDRNPLLAYLHSRGVRRVDYLVATHGDADHSGGLRALLDELAVGEIWESGVGSESSRYAEFREAARRKGVVLKSPHRGQVIEPAPGVTVEVLNPRQPPLAGTPADVNNNSLVLRVGYGLASLLLAADLEIEGERDLVGAGFDLESDVIKIGHHGSVTSSGGEFLRSIRPALAVIQVGRRNRYGMPGPEVLERLKGAGIAVRRTDREGAITVKTDGRHMTVGSMLGRVREWELAPRGGEQSELPVIRPTRSYGR